MQLSYVDHRIQMLQLIMRSWKNRCIILDLIWSNGNVGDHNLSLQYSCITACIAGIISLYQMNSAPVVFISILKQLSIPYIHHSMQLGKCNTFLHYITPMAIFWNMNESNLWYHKPNFSKVFLYSETCLQRPPNGILLCLLELIWVAKGHLDELQKAEIVSKSQLVHSVFIKTHYWINHR